jgi:hypothetical protein
MCEVFSPAVEGALYWVKLSFGALAAVAALMSGIWWIRAARAKVPATSDAVGVGWGGVPVNVRNENGEVLDFLETYAIQSRWNSRAALGSAASAISAGILFLLNLDFSRFCQ